MQILLSLFHNAKSCFLKDFFINYIFQTKLESILVLTISIPPKGSSRRRRKWHKNWKTMLPKCQQLKWQKFRRNIRSNQHLEISTASLQSNSIYLASVLISSRDYLFREKDRLNKLIQIRHTPHLFTPRGDHCDQ